MTYLSFTPYFPTPDSFVGPFVFDQVNAIERANRFDCVLVLKPFPWYALSLQYTYAGRVVYGVRSFQLPSKILPDLFNRLNRWFFFRRLKQLGISKDERIILHLHTSPLAKYGVWAKECFPNCTAWMQHHDLDPLLVRMGILRKCRWHQRMVVRNRVRFLSLMDLQICVSRLTLRQLETFPSNAHTTYREYKDTLRNFADLPPVRIRDSYVLYNGADPRHFHFSETRESRDCFRIGCVAGFYEWKGQLDLIRAVEYLITRSENHAEKIELILLGSGMRLAECRQYVHEHGLSENIRFESVRDHAELPDFFRSLDLFVLPSYFEAFGCVYLEAYACGVPFICSVGQGSTELIPDEDVEKWVAEPQNPEDLAEKIAMFRKERYQQSLTVDWNIDHLIAKFLKEKVK